MVQSCGAINCTERRNKGVHLKFHQIPIKDISLRKAWLHALRRANYNPKCGVVCEKHFKENDYYINPYGTKVLKKGTVPSVFNFPSHLIKVVKERRTSKRKLCVPGQQNGDNVMPSTNCLVQMDTENNDPMDTYTAPVDVSVLQNVNESAPRASTSKIKGNQPISRKRNERDPIYFGDFKESNIEIDFQESDSEINVHGNKVAKKGAALSVLNFPPHLRKPSVPGPQNEDEVRLNTNCGNLLQIDAESNDPVNIASADISVLQNINESAPQASTSKIKENQPISRKRNERDPIYFGDFKESNIEIDFQESDSEINGHGNKVVKKGAALSVFNFLPHLRKPCVPGTQNEDEVRLNTNYGNLLQIDAESNDPVNIASADISVLQNINESAPQASTSKIKENQPISRKRNERDPIYFGDFKESNIEIDFQESDSEINGHGNKVVKKGAALSVFNFPPHLRKPCVPGPQDENEVRLDTNCGNLLQIDAESNDPVNIASAEISVLQNINESAPSASTSKIKENQPISRKRNARDPVFFGDFKASDMEDEIKRKRFWNVAQTTVYKYRKERKYYECKIRRQKTQISNLKALLKELRKEKKSCSTELLVIQVD